MTTSVPPPTAPAGRTARAAAAHRTAPAAPAAPFAGLLREGFRQALDTRPETLSRTRRDDDPRCSTRHTDGRRPLDPTLDADVLAPFLPAPTVLSSAGGCAPHTTTTCAPKSPREDAARLTEQLVRAMRVGRVGGAHELRLRLAPTAGHGDVEIRLRHEDGELRAAVLSHDDGCGAESLAEAVARELAARGLTALAVDVERA